MDKTNERAPLALAIHDLSCVGRCALTVVMPVLAAMGIQPCPMPTAVLSTHTGGYADLAVRDLTDWLPECLRHFQALSLRFDVIYSGYLASDRQAALVEEIISWQRGAGKTLVVVDPVMGDDGRLYSSMPPEMPGKMRRLCDLADVITPNLTEVSLLTGLKYSTMPRAKEEIMEMFRVLSAASCVITSVPMRDGSSANLCKSRDEKGYWRCVYQPVPVHYPGTGDLFAAMLTACLMRGAPIHQAMGYATGFLSRVVMDSFDVNTEVRAGVQLEKALAYINDPQNARQVEFIAYP